MGEHRVRKLVGAAERVAYNRHLINDITALEQMFSSDLFEKSPIRIGAEQELCLIDTEWRPSPKALEVLDLIEDDHFTTEIAVYNLEANLDPLVLDGKCFSTMHHQLEEMIRKADAAAKREDSRILLTGILPSIQTKHLKAHFMAPIERYFALNEALVSLRGQNFSLHIKGADEVNLLHDSVLYEGCNTSFQIHLQIDPDDFVNSYNWAQAISGPVLSICTNSPLLLGKELWNETRIALFAQSIDTRASSYHLNEREARVTFGEDWAKGTAVDVFKDDVVRFRSILTSDFEKDSLEELAAGRIPKLKALGLHNGTIYRWNRPCYGVTNGKPHLRIECRYIPSGPTTVDEMANMVFWTGLMSGRPPAFDNIDQKMNFKDAKNNFLGAARYGMASQMWWKGRLVPSDRLILEELLPIAYNGLKKMNIDRQDANYYLSVIEERIKEKDAATWMRHNYRKLRQHYKKEDACRALAANIYEKQKIGNPISVWELAKAEDANITIGNDKKASQIMTRQVVSVNEHDSAELVAKMMQWRDIHHMPIIDAKRKLKGLVTWTDVQTMQDSRKVPVKDFMKKELIVINPDEAVSMAEKLMNENLIGCLPVVSSGTLVGIITRNDLI